MSVDKKIALYHSCLHLFMGNNTDPQHYRENPVFDLEPIEVFQSSMKPDCYHAFLIGNIFKYVYRYEGKNGKEDLEKAKTYIDFLIADLDGKKPLDAFKKEQTISPSDIRECPFINDSFTGKWHNKDPYSWHVTDPGFSKWYWILCDSTFEGDVKKTDEFCKRYVQGWDNVFKHPSTSFYRIDGRKVLYANCDPHMYRREYKNWRATEENKVVAEEDD